MKLVHLTSFSFWLQFLSRYLGKLSNEQASSEAQVQNDMILKQKEAIEKEIQASHQLIDVIEEVKVLETQFCNDPTFLKNAIQLQEKYVSLRRTRPDGNCMYRALAFGQFERMIQDHEEAKRFKKCVDEAKEEMVKLGFPVFTMEDFYDNFVDQIDTVTCATEDDEDARSKKLNDLIEVFNDEGQSNYLVAFMRLLCSMQIKKEADLYINFLDGDTDVHTFCALEVEPMFKESDIVHIHALSKAMNVIVRIVYLDRSVKDDISTHDFPEDSSAPNIHLLYRPGHYDLLYTK
jgi:ubiquitin thioesterase protein OTUB1